MASRTCACEGEEGEQTEEADTSSGTGCATRLVARRPYAGSDVVGDKDARGKTLKTNAIRSVENKKMVPLPRGTKLDEGGRDYLTVEVTVVFYGVGKVERKRNSETNERGEWYKAGGHSRRTARAQ